MVPRENAVIGVFVVSAFVLLYVLPKVTTLPTWASSAVIIGVGVIAPLLVNSYLDGTRA